MQVKKLQTAIGDFKSYLRSNNSEKYLYIWESQQIFQTVWDIEATNWHKMYDKSLNNSTTRKLWRRAAYEPKKMMLSFINLEAQYVQYMFSDLFNEDKEIGGRIDRFVFYCDELLTQFKTEYPASIENNHYHGDNYEMIALYLAFRYPSQYALYNFDAFKSTLEKLGTRNIPLTHDMPRYFKVMRTLHQFLQKDKQLVELHQRRLDKKMHYQGESLLLAYEFCQIIKII